MIEASDQRPRNDFFRTGRAALVSGEVDWEKDDIRCLLVGGYHPDLSEHESLSDIPPGHRATSSRRLQGRVLVVVNWHVSADASTIRFPIPNQLVTGIVMFCLKPDGTTILVAYIGKATGLPLAPSAEGGPVVVKWSQGPSRVFLFPGVAIV